jgi:hypothetical protein
MRQGAPKGMSIVKEKPKGYGRNGARDYTGAQRIKISHQSLKSGDSCPLCEKGKVYTRKTPAYIVRLFGRSPIGAMVHEIRIFLHTPLQTNWEIVARPPPSL